MNLQEKLENACRRLTSLNSDGALKENEVGWSKIHTQVGHSLTKQIGRWSPAQLNLAWKICSTYRNTQLVDLEIPQWTKNDAITAPEPAESIHDVLKTLTWDKPRLVKTKTGPKIVTSAVVPEGHAFWAVWRRSKDEAKRLGYGVSMFRDQWTVTLWQDPGGTKPEPSPTVTTSPAPETLPTINTAGLLAYQVPSVQRLVASVRALGAVLDASDVGTGKTYSALAACRELGLKPLVVCPKSVIPSWKKAAKHFGLTIEAINYELVRRGSLAYCSQHTDFRGRTSFSWDLDALGCTALIFDEVHRCKAQTSLNSKLLIAAKRQEIPTLALSATAATDPTEMKAIGYLLELFGSPSEHWSWCLRNGCSQGRFGGIKFGHSEAALRSIHQSIYPAKGTRIRVADLGDAFPETQINTQLVSLNGNTEKVNEAYRLAEEAVERVRSKQATDSSHHLTLMLRARQISEASKIPLLADMVEDSVESGLSVAVFLNFQDSIATLQEAIQAKFGAEFPVSIIQGGQTSEERQAAIEAFQADRARVIIANIQAGGVGVSLHDLNGKHARIALISPTWSAIDLRQTLGRVHRAGGKTKSLQRIIYAEGTVEERVAASVQAKLDRLDQLNDGELSGNLL